MNNYIKIKIPDELKKKFEEDKFYLENLSFGKRKAKTLKLFLDNNMVVEALNLIDEITILSSNNYIQNIGFYKDFKKWLDFSLKEIMKAFRIDISTVSKEKDIYLALEQAEKQLKGADTNNVETIIKRAEYFANKQKDSVFYNPDMYNMCEVFIRIGLQNTNLNALVDISYENYIKKTKNVFGITYEEFCKLDDDINNSQNKDLDNFTKVKK